MQGLLGDFTTMPLKDLVAYLGNKRATGTLKIERDDVRKQAVIQQGQVIYASSNQRREYLGQFLINMGRLTEEQFDKAYQTQRETDILMGKILVMIGLVPEDVVMSALSLQAREMLLEAFGWTEGTFTFDASPLPARREGLELRVDLLDLQGEAEFRETAWQAIRGPFPHGGLRLKLERRKLPEPPTPGSLDARLAGMIEDDFTIDEMILSLNATDFSVYQRLYALYRLEAVKVAGGGEAEIARPPGEEEEEDDMSVSFTELDEPEGPPAAEEPDTEEVSFGGPAEGDPGSASEIADRAQLYLATGNPQQAELLARKAFELAPGPETAELLRKAEAALTTRLKSELLEKRRVPTLMVPPATLKSMELSAPERYLLSRIDGLRDVGAIVQVSPLQELEALRLMQRFVDTGLVRLG